VLFAPVYFDAGVYAHSGFSYSPWMVIDLGVFVDCLFLRPSYGHYYFGDYYAAGYIDAGYYAPFSFYSGRYGYDPIYAHQRWEHRGDRDWALRVETDFRHRRDHEEARPPRTWVAQSQPIPGEAKAKTARPVIAVPLARVAKSPDNPTRFRPVAQDEKQSLVQRGQEVRKLREEREKLEIPARDTPVEKPPRESEPPRVSLPKSPIVAKPPTEIDKRQTPPERHQTPAPDAQVEPKPREPGGKHGSPKR